jgi:hypothetical protein
MGPDAPAFPPVLYYLFKFESIILIIGIPLLLFALAKRGAGMDDEN